MNQNENTTTFYIDLDKLEYNESTLRFLRKKLDSFTIELFRQIVRENRKHRGLVKTRLEDYFNMRKKYDAAFLMLEAQGFIERREDGTSTPYFVTIRGQQLLTILAEEDKLKKLEEDKHETV